MRRRLDTLGRRIAHLRRTNTERGGEFLSQAAAAKRLGVSRQSLSAWERDAAQPSAENVLGLAALYGVSPDYIVSGRGPAQGEHHSTPAHEAEVTAGAPEQAPGRREPDTPVSDPEQDSSAATGARIAELRRAVRPRGRRRMTQAELAERVGVERRTVTGWESGQYRPAGEYLARLADALGSTVQYILTGARGERPSRFQLLDFDPPGFEGDPDKIGNDYPRLRQVRDWEVGHADEADPPRAGEALGEIGASTRQTEHSGIHGEPCRPSTVILLDSNLAALDRLAADIQEKNGTTIPRSGIIRAMIRAIASSGVDLSGIGNEEELSKRIAAKLAT